MLYNLCVLSYYIPHMKVLHSQHGFKFKIYFYLNSEATYVNSKTICAEICAGSSKGRLSDLWIPPTKE